MDFMDELTNLAFNISNSVLPDSVKDIINDIDRAYREKKVKMESSQPIKSIFNFPKFEMIIKEENYNDCNNDSYNIEHLMTKYIPKSLSEKFEQMGDEDINRFYNALGQSYSKIDKLEGFIAELLKASDRSKDYLKFTKKKTIDVKEAYDLFDKYNDKIDSKGAEIAELCLKLSNYKDTENKFSEIYNYLGKYYYHHKNEYKKALEYFEKVLEYSDSNSLIFQTAKYHMVLACIKLGFYKKGSDLANELKDYNIDFPPNINKERADRLKDSLLRDWRLKIEEIKKILQLTLSSEQNKEQNKEQEEDVFINCIAYEFEDCKDKYSENLLVKASNHYWKAEKLIDQGKDLEAYEEFKRAKWLVPEKKELINDRIIMLINSFTVNEDNKKYYYGEKIKVLNENLEIALKTKRNLCYCYQELASTYSDLKNFDKEIEYWKKAVDVAGYVSIYGLNLASTYKRVEQYDEALKIYEYIWKKDPCFAKSYNTNIEYLISEIKDLKQGKKTNNKGKSQLDVEHSIKGDEYFNKREYEKAFTEYNASCEINKNEIIYLIKKIMVKEMNECPYWGSIAKEGCVLSYFDEMEIVSEALMFCEKNGKFDYLPFLFTLCGDFCQYGGGGAQEAEIFYELAVDLLNKIPLNEKFVLPYYKLARIKEQRGKYEEALTLLNYTAVLDKSIDTQKDSNRLKSFIEDGGVNNLKESSKLISEMESYLKSGAYSEVIQSGKKALVYAPDNVKIYYLICQAAELKNNYYELKLAAKEGLRAYNNESTHKIYDAFLYFYFWLGKCCKFENKRDQAKYYFEKIESIDDDITKDITKRAKNELFLMLCGRKRYDDVD